MNTTGAFGGARVMGDLRDFEDPGVAAWDPCARRLLADLSAAGVRVPDPGASEGEPWDLESAVRRALAAASRRFPGLRITARMEHGGVLGLASEDLETALAEVLANAAESCGEHPRRPIAVEVAAVPGRDGRLDVVVSDDGEGMSDDLLRRAHLPFVTTKANRLGLGLDRAARLLVRDGMSLQLAAPSEGGVVVTLAGVAAAAARVAGGRGLIVERDLIDGSR